jgi:hypothetical protein
MSLSKALPPLRKNHSYSAAVLMAALGCTSPVHGHNLAQRLTDINFDAEPLEMMRSRALAGVPTLLEGDTIAPVATNVPCLVDITPSASPITSIANSIFGRRHLQQDKLTD